MDKRGFTIIEFISVALIVSALAVIIAPSVSQHLDSGQLEQSRQRGKEVIRMVRERAIAEEATYRLLWNIAANQWEIYRWNGGAFTLDKTEGLPERIQLISTTLPGNQVDFDRLGSPSSGGAVTLQDQSGTSGIITILAGSGIVQLP